MVAKIDRAGHRYGRLVVIRQAESVIRPGGYKHAKWLCKCDCGNERLVSACHLSTGHTRSCGCLARDTTSSYFTKHGMVKTPMYNAWRSIKERCFCTTTEAYDRYGGRGITMHPAWVDDFAAFYAYVGDCPSPGMSLDRINNDGNYEPGNVRWATAKEQANNRRPRKRKPKCHLGHDLTPENTYVQKKTGYRYCKACKVLRDAKYKAAA
jgi:hypothetical protein